MRKNPIGQVNAHDAFEKPKAYLNNTNTTEQMYPYVNTQHCIFSSVLTTPTTMKCSFRLSSLGDLACRKSFFYFSRESCSPSGLSITVCAFKMATQSKVHETVSWQMNTRASIYSQQRRIHSTTFTFSSRFLFFLSVFFAALLCCLAWRYRGAAPFY